MVRYLLVAILIVPVMFSSGHAQAQRFEEIVVSLKIPRLMTQDIIVEYDGDDIYLPLIEIFGYLGTQVKANISENFYTGVFFADNREFKINLNTQKAFCRDQDFLFKRDDYYQTSTELYLNIKLYEKIFGLKMRFEFSDLLVVVPFDESFPAFRRLQREQAHDKLEREVAVLKDIQTMPTRRAYFSGAAVDWLLSTSPVGENQRHYFDVSMGGMVLGGDLALSGTGNSQTGFAPEQIRYNWHYFVGENHYLTQADLGYVYSDGAFARSLKGVMLTNRPIERRKYFQTIQISDHVGTNWEVELYINNRLVDFTYTDQYGNYNFLVDIYYGSTRVTLKMYGPNGEIRSDEQYISVPYNLIPKNEIEYTVLTGVERNSDSGIVYTIGNAYYGLFNNLTVGLGSEIPMGKTDDEENDLKPQGGLDLTYQPMGELTLGSFISPDNYYQGNFSYVQPSLVNLSGSYTKYVQDFDRVVQSRRLQTAGLNISSPIKIGSRYIGLRYSVTWNEYTDMDNINMTYGMNTSLPYLFFNYNGNYKITRYPRHSVTNITSQMMFSTNIMNWLRPQLRLEYDHEKQAFSKYSVSFVKRLFKTIQMSVSYERNVFSRNNVVSIMLNFFSDFAYFSSRMLFTDRSVNVNQVQRGSISYNHLDHQIRFDRSNSVGYGSAVLRPFMDDNFNGMMDEGESYLEDTRLNIKGLSGRDYGDRSKFFYNRLRPYYDYTLHIDPTSLDNPLLKPVHENIKVKFNPNMTTGIDVPLVMGAEVSGMVIRRTAKGEIGVGGVKVDFFNTTTESVTEVSTFNNGDFYFLGLLPGRYRAYINTSQLESLGYHCEPGDIEFEVLPEKDGAIIEDINFSLSTK